MEFNTNNVIIYSTLVIVVILVIYILVRLKTNHENFDVTNNNNIAAITNLGTIAAQMMKPNAGGVSGQLIIPADNTIFKGSLTATSFNLLPTGLIVAWNNAGSIPSGWILCDGTNSTPDLRGKFILGAGQGVGLTNRNLTDTGGEETHVLTIPEMPSHNHAPVNAVTFGPNISGSNPLLNEITANQYGSLSTSSSIANTGGDPTNNNKTVPHNNMPPFYVLVYIMKL